MNFLSGMQQVLNLGQIEIVDTWREGDVRYQKFVTMPDYERYSNLNLPTLSLPFSSSFSTDTKGNLSIIPQTPARAMTFAEAVLFEEKVCLLPSFPAILGHIPYFLVDRRWVPKAGRRYVKEPDIMFFDTVAYDPQLLEGADQGFRMHITSYLPLLGEKVQMCYSIYHLLAIATLHTWALEKVLQGK